jgi:ABC-2 type transport system ATP-binding protein
MDEILRAEHVTKQYTGHRALDDVSVAIPRGSVYGLLGPNGAGKTTLIRIINHITAPDQGAILFNGRPLEQADVQNIGYLPEERGLYKKMKVGEQVLYLAQLKGLSKKEATKRAKEWFVRFQIQDWWNKKIEELSKGMAQKVQFITTVLHEPELLIFDEPFSGFDPLNAQLLKDEMMRLKDRGATIIFSTHNMASVEEVCTHITLINKSRNILTGPLDEIRRQNGAGIYEVEYRGDEGVLKNALQGFGTILDGEEEHSRALKNLKIHIPQPERVRGAIAAINETVEINSFREIIPSMNDIFIKAVSGNAPTNV